MIYLGQFSTLNHHITLYSNLFIYRLKGLKRRKDGILPFFCYDSISVGGGITQPWDISVSFPLLSIILYSIITYLHVVWKCRRDNRIASCHSFFTTRFRLKGGITQPWHILVSFPLLSIILHLILTYLHVVWRARRDERITCVHCFSIARFLLGLRHV